MENEKKPSRLGVRLSAIVVVVLLVVCMAVPVFAFTVEPDEYNKLPFPLVLPDGCDYYVMGFSYEPSTGEKYTCYALSSLSDGFPTFSAVEGVSGKYQLQTVSGNGTVYRVKLSATGEFLTEWVDVSKNYKFFSKGTIYSNIIVYTPMGSVYYEPQLPPPPPPPDLKESVSSGLTIVLDWVGATVSALFSGELAGLLPLVAIPVAITLLLVAIIVIKRSIWGA